MNDAEIKDAEIRMNACKNHPEKQQIFYLEKLIGEAGYPYFFNFWEDLRPVFGGEKDGDPESIDWNSYNFLIELGHPVGFGLAQISVCFNQAGDRKLLELLDMRKAEGKENPTAKDGELYVDMTAEDCMEIINKFFDSLLPVQVQEPELPEDYFDDEEDDIETVKCLREATRKITGIDPDEVDKKVKCRK